MRDSKYYHKRAKEIIKSIHYLTLATVTKNGSPWNSPLAYSVDDNFNFYFGSPQYTQHAQNIRNNSKGFVVIYDSKAPDGEGEGVYFTATAKELVHKKDIENALNVMFGLKHSYSSNSFKGKSKLRIYQLTPQQVWMNDADEKSGLYYDYRVEINLSR